MEKIESFYKREYARKVNAIARILRGDRTKAEDIVQQAFMKAIEKYDQYDEEKGKIDPWINFIIYNTLRDRLRKDAVERNAMKELAEMELPCAGYDPDDGPPHFSITYLYEAGYTRKEIARELNLNPRLVADVIDDYRKELLNDLRHRGGRPA